MKNETQILINQWRQKIKIHQCIKTLFKINAFILYHLLECLKLGCVCQSAAVNLEVFKPDGEAVISHIMLLLSVIKEKLQKLMLKLTST